MTKLRSGITTGTCAAAAAKAAALICCGQQPAQVKVVSPQGQVIVVDIATGARTPDGAAATVIKDAGDDADITHGAAVSAHVRLTDRSGIAIRGGSGIGYVTKPGLPIPIGQPAINPGPRTMITQAIEEILTDGRGAVVTISIADGEQLARRTLNSSLGIVGGLSIIGTTGIVHPMSETALKDSLLPQISVARALGHTTLVLVPGKIGQNIAVHTFGLPAEAVVQTSNFIGHMLQNAAEQGIQSVLLLGHLGKLVKVAAGIFQTHSKTADARMETLAAYAGAAGAPPAVIQQILDCITTEAAMPIIERCALTSIYTTLAARASSRSERHVHHALAVGTAIVTLKGGLLGYDDAANKLGGALGWNIK